ncbi:MAG TPA: DsbA family protein [Bacillota bacterium]|nr:DsbA family protein [Bacillota bacterium]
MGWNNLKTYDSNVINTSEKHNLYHVAKKPIEIYVFIDPLCLESWALEPYFKKLSIEYGRFFTVRPIISGSLDVLTKNNDGPQTNEQKRISFPWIGLAIKAAELQGINAGRTFLRKLQVYFFLKNKNIADKSVLIQCAEESDLDVHEFEKDLFSHYAKKAFQCDLKLKKEMDVTETPTVVIFNHLNEEHGIKIPGRHTYDIYKHVLHEVLQYEPLPAVKPPIRDFLSFYDVVSTKDVSTVYDLTIDEANRRLKKLQIMQITNRLTSKHDSFWKYNRK